MFVVTFMRFGDETLYTFGTFYEATAKAVLLALASRIDVRLAGINQVEGW